MKKPEITPGPWLLRTALYSAHITSSGLPVADVQACHLEPWRANAKAIAALPDLLEALERAVSIIEDLPHPENIPAQDLRQALVKAGYTFD